MSKDITERLQDYARDYKTVTEIESLRQQQSHETVECMRYGPTAIEIQMNDIKQERNELRQQLDAARLEIQQCDRLRELQFEEFTKQIAELRQQVTLLRDAILQNRAAKSDWELLISDARFKKALAATKEQ